MTKSQRLYNEAVQLMPGGVNSPVRSFKHVGGSPIYFEKGDGPYLFDVDGNRYIDFCLSFGPHLLGHSAPVIVSALREQLGAGTTFGACNPKEIDLARLILRAYPFLQRVRLVNSGTEAVMTAVRLARAYTGRSKILKFEGCYHGHMDGLLVKAGSGVAHLSEASSKGIPAASVSDTLVARYDDIASIEAALRENSAQDSGRIAAIIVEPIPANHGLWIPTHDHIKKICDLAHEAGSLVIFDEVITGFRLGLGGASHFFHLNPDLVTLGKVVGGGLPLAAVVGTEAIMNCLAPLGDVYQAGTLSGNILSSTAGCAVLEWLFKNKNVYASFDRTGESFVSDLKTLLSRAFTVEITSLGSLFWMQFGGKREGFPAEVSVESSRQYAEFFTRAIKNGIYLPPSPYEVGFLSLAHTPHVLEEALDRFEQCLA